MKFAAALLWWKYRRHLKAKGYSLKSFCALSYAYGRHCTERLTSNGLPGRQPMIDVGSFSRNDLRARW
jgi:hypothetical protein